MKFFSIGGFIYPFSVEDAEDEYFELEQSAGTVVMEAWTRGVVFREDGTFVTDATQVAEVQNVWSRVAHEHHYFKKKNEESLSAQAAADKVFYERLSTVNFGKPVARNGRKIEILPTVEG